MTYFISPIRQKKSKIGFTITFIICFFFIEFRLCQHNFHGICLIRKFSISFSVWSRQTCYSTVGSHLGATRWSPHANQKWHCHSRECTIESDSRHCHRCGSWRQKQGKLLSKSIYYARDFSTMMILIRSNLSLMNEQDGQLVPVTLKAGDNVLLPEYGGTKVKLDDKVEYQLFKEGDILAKLE